MLKEDGRNAGIDGVTHQMLHRTCSTYMAQITSVKDVQAHLRHTNAKTILEHYIKSVPESVRVAVESFGSVVEEEAEWLRSAGELNPFEPNSAVR